MSSLRWLSTLFGIFILLFVFYISRRQRLRNKDKLLAIAVSAGLILLGINPDLYTGLLSAFSFEKGNGDRILGLLLFAVFLGYLLIFQMQARINILDHTIDRLINELAKQKYRQDSEKQATPTISVVIPAYNEEDNIGKVLAALPKTIMDMPLEAIVVVDGGTDNTEKVARMYPANVARHVINRGGGAALHVGYDLALELGSRIVVTLDADGQHDPAEIERLVQPILRGEADMVNGSRVLGSYEKEQFIRSLGVVWFNWLISALTMQRITDCSNAFRAISAEALAEVRPHLVQRQYHSTEILIELLKRNKRVLEVPITIRRRNSGVSKKGPTTKYAIGFFRTIMATWLR
jgi:cellulose synthase/poly-beta-1,6-N-acetylglucosamine synthase-like glycosyltransferase